jgi:hypothetical protein
VAYQSGALYLSNVQYAEPIEAESSAVES